MDCPGADGDMRDDVDAHRSVVAYLDDTAPCECSPSPVFVKFMQRSCAASRVTPHAFYGSPRVERLRVVHKTKKTEFV